MQMRRTLVSSTALLTLLVFAGCQGDRDADNSKVVLRVAMASEPLAPDPGLTTDLVTGNIVLNLMDPLVRLNDKLEPVPALAESWETSDDGKTVTFRLRGDGRWTNGDVVTAADFEYAWKRILDPELAAGYAYQFYGVAGAADYNGCEKDCEGLRNRIGIKALDDRTIEVKLTSRQPWFLAQVAHTSFLPVHRATVEKFGRHWSEPANIVSNGPYRLTDRKHGESITLTKWEGWRAADSVKIERIAARVIMDKTTALDAFEAGEIDACLWDACIPRGDIERLQEDDSYVHAPGLATRWFAVNLKTVPDVNQRRALAFALDRTSLVENVTQAGEKPATSVTPTGMPGFEAIAQDFLPERAALVAAGRYLDRVSVPKRKLTFAYLTSDTAPQQTAVAVQAMWQQIGIETTLRGLEFQQFLELLGPPLDASIDVALTGSVGDFADDINFLELFTCRSGNNPSGYCDRGYDRLIERARATPNEADRHELYAQAEAMLTGPKGAMPIIPAYWGTWPTMRKPGIEGWKPNPLGIYDFAGVSVAEG